MSFVREGSKGPSGGTFPVSVLVKKHKVELRRRKHLSEGHCDVCVFPSQISSGTTLQSNTVRVTRELTGSADNTARQTPVLAPASQNEEEWTVKTARAEGDAPANEP